MRSITRGTLAALSLATLLSAAAPAQAMEVTCIEASRYKHIFRIFDNDPNRFATFFGADPHRLPSPEACRAVVVTGSIDATNEGDRNSDADRLIDAIRQGGGWLSTIYVASPGGNIAMGLKLGELTRMFWLNTNAVENGTFDYVPDFLGSRGPGSDADVPANLQNGYANFVATTQSFAHLQMNEKSSRRCASACTYMHAAGIYRLGSAYFHRGRSGRSSEGKDLSMTQVIESLQRSENRIVAFYRTMDSGEEAIQAFQSTASETTLAAPIPMMPRYVGDFLKKQCGQSEHASSQRAFPAGSADIQCLSAANSRERLLQYGKLCPNGCDHKVLIREALHRASALLPEETSERQPPFQRGSTR
jgi:hypothetical protein